MKTLIKVKETEKTIIVKEEIPVNYVEFKDFEEFLEKNDALGSFANNISKSFHKLDIKPEIITSDPKHAVGMAFVWSRTPEGHSYWHEIENAWQRYLEKNDIAGWAENI